jgi:hypothetical protein
VTPPCPLCSSFPRHAQRRHCAMRKKFTVIPSAARNLSFFFPPPFLALLTPPSPLRTPSRTTPPCSAVPLGRHSFSCLSFPRKRESICFETIGELFILRSPVAPSLCGRAFFCTAARCRAADARRHAPSAAPRGASSRPDVRVPVIPASPEIHCPNSTCACTRRESSADTVN